MTTRQTIATSDEVFAGRGYENALYALNHAKGRPINFLTKFDLGTPVVAVPAGIISAATSAELPNNATITYTPASTGSPVDAVAPLTEETITTVDGSVLCWVLDTPRNLTCVASHGSAVVATTITVTGYDRTRNKIVKTMTLTAGGTDKSDATTATMKYIKSVAITSAGNSTTNTVSVGFGDILGLPYRLAEKEDLIAWFFDGGAETTMTVVPAVTSAVSATSGDTRGTVTCAGTLNGSKKVKGWMHVSDANAASRAGLLGITQYAG